MPNTARGEVTITIAGRPYDVAMTLDFLARAAAALGTVTMSEFESRIPEFRPADMPLVLVALCEGNGIDGGEAIARRATVSEYVTAMRALWGVRPADTGSVSADPPTRAS